MKKIRYGTYYKMKIFKLSNEYFTKICTNSTTSSVNKNLFSKDSIFANKIIFHMYSIRVLYTYYKANVNSSREKLLRKWDKKGL